MLNTPWSDGVPGITQLHIEPGESFTYKWTATQYGSYWYHAHEAGQLDDGLYGHLLIHPRQSLETPFSLIASDAAEERAMAKAAKDPIPLLLGDWRHIVSEEAIDITMAANTELSCYDSILVNGKGKVNCWSAEKTASLVTPEQRQILTQANLTDLTGKRYVPTAIMCHNMTSTDNPAAACRPRSSLTFSATPAR